MTSTHQYVDDLMGGATVARFGYFDSKKTDLLMRKIRAGRASGYKDNMAFVTLLSTQSWHRQFVEEFATRFPAANSQNLTRVS